MGLGWWWKGAPFRRSGCGVGVDPWCCAQGTVNGRREEEEEQSRLLHPFPFFSSPVPTPEEKGRLVGAGG